MKAFSKVISANDLMGGQPVWFTPEGTWSDLHAQAELFTDKDTAKAALERANDDPHVVGPYLGEACPGADGPEPAHFREAFRVTGPTRQRRIAPIGG